METKKVNLKSSKKLKPYARYLGGDMSETVHYFIKNSDKQPMKSFEEVDQGFFARGFHVLEHGKEFLVVDHPNPISKGEYEQIKVLFEEKPERSMKGVC